MRLIPKYKKAHGITFAHIVQAETALTLAWTNSVPVEVRGKVGGVFAVAMGLGTVVGPPALSIFMAWSLQAHNRLVDYHAVFVAEAILMVFITVLGRKALTLESLTVPVENRQGVEYESLSQSSGGARTPSSAEESLVEVITTARRVENGQRRRHSPAA